jgi:hypothetical protein
LFAVPAVSLGRFRHLKVGCGQSFLWERFVPGKGKGGIWRLSGPEVRQIGQMERLRRLAPEWIG